MNGWVFIGISIALNVILQLISNNEHRLFPELALLEDDKRSEALGRARQYSNKLLLARIAFGFGLICLMCASVPVARVMPNGFIFCANEKINILINFLLAFSVLVVIYKAPVFFVRTDVRYKLRRVLNEMNVPVCLVCGYDLRGQEEPRCPECGDAFNPK